MLSCKFRLPSELSCFLFCFFLYVYLHIQCMCMESYLVLLYVHIHIHLSIHLDIHSIKSRCYLHFCRCICTYLECPSNRISSMVGVFFRFDVFRLPSELLHLSHCTLINRIFVWLVFF